MANRFAFLGHELIGDFLAGKLVEAGWERTHDIAQADVAFTYCIGSSLLEDAYFDGTGLIKNAAANTVLVDLSPSTPSFSREISAVATVSNLVFVEAPLVVNDPFSPMEFTCYAACEEPDAIEEVRDVLDALACEVVLTGDVGSAQLAKAAHTVKAIANAVGAIEANALANSAHELGLPGGEHDDDEDFTQGYPVELALADVVAAMTTADDYELILPQLEAAMHLLELMVVIGGADLNLNSLSLLYREEAASAAHGLDWTRAEGLYAEQVADWELGDDHHDHNHDHHSHEGLGFDDDFGFSGGFGGYSAN